MVDPLAIKILLAEAESPLLQALTVTLRSWGHEVVPVGTREDAIQSLEGGPFDLLLADFTLSGKKGIDLVRAGKERDPAMLSVVMPASASFDKAVDAIKAGAFDYLPKPFSNSQLGHVLGKVSALISLRRENQKLRGPSCRQDYFAGQTSAAMTRLEEFVRKIAPTDANILLTGENGTGKTELARFVHSRSSRSHRALEVVNCTSHPGLLLESELFGHAQGAFTGAAREHVGRLELANHGTVLIDEIGDLSPNGQAKLLRLLQEKVIERVGARKAIPLDVRVIATSNTNLENAVKEGRFSEDLYFRLNIFGFQLVPLRHRKEDLPVLIQRYLKEASQAAGVEAVMAVPDAVVKRLMEYPWPGNARELKSALERLVLLSEGRQMRVSDLPEALQSPTHRSADPGPGEFRTLEELERAEIERVLAVERNQDRAAKILGITTVTLWRKRKEYRIP